MVGHFTFTTFSFRTLGLHCRLVSFSARTSLVLDHGLGHFGVLRAGLGERRHLEDPRSLGGLGLGSSVGERPNSFSSDFKIVPIVGLI